jgi:hypothetical protein
MSYPELEAKLTEEFHELKAELSAGKAMDPLAVVRETLDLGNVVFFIWDKAIHDADTPNEDPFIPSRDIATLDAERLATLKPWTPEGWNETVKIKAIDGVPVERIENATAFLQTGNMRISEPGPGEPSVEELQGRRRAAEVDKEIRGLGQPRER